MSRANIPKDHPPEHPLPCARREKLVQELASGKSIREAAAAAGYKRDTAAGQAFKSEPVMARYRHLTGEGAKRAMVTIEGLFKRIAEQATFDPLELLDVRNPEDLQLVPEEVRRLLVKGWSWDRNGRFLLELVDKEKAIDRLARHLSFYNDTAKVEISSFSERLRRAQERLKGEE